MSGVNDHSGVGLKVINTPPLEDYFSELVSLHVADEGSKNKTHVMSGIFSSG